MALPLTPSLLDLAKQQALWQGGTVPQITPMPQPPALSANAIGMARNSASVQASGGARPMPSPAQQQWEAYKQTVKDDQKFSVKKALINGLPLGGVINNWNTITQPFDVYAKTMMAATTQPYRDPNLSFKDAVNPVKALDKVKNLKQSDLDTYLPMGEQGKQYAAWESPNLPVPLPIISPFTGKHAQISVKDLGEAIFPTPLDLIPGGKPALATGKAGIKATGKLIGESLANQGIRNASDLLQPQIGAVGKNVNKPKEVWQMTKAEFVNTVKDKIRKQKTRENIPFTEENLLNDVIESDIVHKGEIQYALSEGKPVPHEVLKDYPDLLPKAGKKLPQQPISPKVETPPIVEPPKIGPQAVVPEKPITTSGSEIPPIEPPKPPPTAQPEQPGFAGNIRLSKWDEAFHDDLKTLTQDPAFVEKARRGTRSNQVTIESAQGLIDKTGGNPEKIVKSLGSAYNAEEAYALDGLLAKADTDWQVAREALEKNPLDQVLQLRNAEAQAKAAYLSAKAMGARAELGRGLQQYKILRQTLLSNDVRKMQAVLKQVGADHTDEFLEASKKIDWGNPVQVNALARQFIKPNWWDYPLEVFINSILSGPRTHIVNVGSTGLYTLKEPLDTLLAGLTEIPLSKMQGRARAVFPGEARAELQVAAQGFKDGFRAFLKTAKDGIPPDDVSRLEIKPDAFTGKTGRVIGFPTTMLSAEDQGFYALNYAMAKAKLAYRKVQQMKLKGADADKAFKDIYTDPVANISKQADEIAKDRLFRRDAGKSTQALMNLRESFVPLKFIIPFIRTPVNLAKVGLETSPLGIFNPKLWKNLKAKDPEAASQLSKIMTGSVIAAGLYLYAKDGLITGAAPNNVTARDRFYREGKQPYSLKIGDKWVSYQRVEPFNQLFTQVAALADASSSENQESVINKAGQLATTIGKNFVSQTYMSSISDLIEALSDPARYGENVASKLTSGMVPYSAAIRTAAQGLDTTYRQPDGILEGLQSQTPFLSEQVPAKLNAFGEDIKRTTPWFSPINISPEQDTKLNAELAKYEVNTGFVSDAISKLSLSRDEQFEYQQGSGQLVKQKMLQVINSPEYLKATPYDQEKMITSASLKAKDEAKDQYLMNSDFTKPHAEDDPETAFKRYDLAKVADYLKVTKSIENENIRSMVTKAMKLRDADLEVALKLTGYSSGNLVNPESQTLLSNRQNGKLDRLGSSYNPKEIELIKQYMTPYYAIPGEAQIKQYVWSKYPPEYQALGEQLQSYLKTGNNTAAYELYRKYPDLITAVKMVDTMQLNTSRARANMKAQVPVIAGMLKMYQ